MAVAKLRAPVQWFGGKGLLRARILPLIPATKVYVEPYGGAGSVLFGQEPAPVEVYNDLNGDLVNLFRVLQDPRRFRAFQHRIEHTLYSREEFVTAIETLADPEAKPADRAWAFFTAQNQGFGGKGGMSAGDWGRAFVDTAGMANTTNKWLMRLAHLPDWHRRLARVQIDNRCALGVIRYWDSRETTFYVDPPYVLATRSGRGDYAHEADDAHHRALVDTLLGIQGAAVVSGYRHPIYRPLEQAGWERTDIRTVSHAAGRVRGSGLQGIGTALAKAPRIETIWRNPKAVKLTALKAAA
jgi:DNA adenine methylase